MKKINTVFLVCMMLLSIMIPVLNVDAIEQHEVSDGETYGNIMEAGTYTGNNWTVLPENDWVWGLTTDNNYFWSLDSDRKVYKYNMDGSYANHNFSTIGTSTTIDITNNGTHLFITHSLPDPEILVYKMDGTFVAQWDVEIQSDTTPIGITTDGNFIWVMHHNYKVYKYFMNGVYTGIEWSVNHPFVSLSGMTLDDKYIWITGYNPPRVYKYNMNGTYTDLYFNTPEILGVIKGIANNGRYFYIVDGYDDRVHNYTMDEPFDVNRTEFSSYELNKIFSFSPVNNYSGNVTLKVPVSNNIQGIISVVNNSGGGIATEVNSSDELENDTFWFDSANKFVYIETIDITTSTIINWTINCSYGATFNIQMPQYLEVGDYFIACGLITDSTGVALNGIATTRILYQNGTIAIDPVHKWNCTSGNYYCVISTTTLEPGLYSVSIEFEDTNTGITIKYGQNLYLSWSPQSGIYSDAILQINWYNTNEGLGLPEETLKLYINGQRKISKTYYSYIGQEINLTIKDYYNFSLYSNNHTITSTYNFIDLGLTFHEYDFTNTNDEYYIASFRKQGANRWFEKIVPSQGQKDFMLPSGNYTIRVYNADNSSYVQWTQTIDRSRGYLISGNNITQVIEGQSVIRGQILELSSEIDNALMPDVQIICRNPPIVFSCFDRIGMMLGGDYIKICPALNIIAQTREERTGNWMNSTPLIPSNGTIENGTITILEDIIYFTVVNATTPSWVNITYTSNGTLIQNTTYIPNKFYPEGFNVTINASDDIHITREIRFNQLKKFYWDYYAGTNNPGWITESNGQKRTGYHRAGLEIENTMNTIWYDVYVYAGFSTETTPDLSTVRVKDVDNNNVILEEGEQYKASSGIEFKITGSIDIGETRNFLGEYYSSYEDQYYYGSDVVHINSYEINKRIDEKLYNYFEYTWINSYDQTYRGGLKYFFDFENPTGIKQEDTIVYDVGLERNITDYVISDQFLEIGSNAVGDVSPGGGKTFKVYFKFNQYPGENPEDFHLATPMVMWGDIPISFFLIFVFIGLIIMVFGILMIAFRDKKGYREYGKGLAGIGLLIAVVTWILSALGV